MGFITVHFSGELALRNNSFQNDRGADVERRLIVGFIREVSPSSRCAFIV